MLETRNARIRAESSEAILQAARHYGDYCLPSLLVEATNALGDVRAVLSEEHGITVADTDNFGGDILAGRILDATVRAAQRRSMDVSVDPIELLGVVARAASARLGMPLEPVEGPTGEGPEHGYVVLPRHSRTPQWGPTGDAPLLVKLARYDTGKGLGPWEWCVAPAVHGTIDGRDVIGLPPSPEVAAEVGEFAAAVLIGVQRLRHGRS